MSRALRRSIVAVLIGLIVSTGIVAATSPAFACPIENPGCDSGGDGPSGDTNTLSDGTKQATYQAPTKSCSVYANGAGMGMSCVRLGGGDVKTLRERFGNQKLQRCRYSEIPPAIQEPQNLRPTEGRYMLMTSTSTRTPAAVHGRSSCRSCSSRTAPTSPTVTTTSPTSSGSSSARRPRCRSRS
jgi:hypothetical protein